MSGPVPIGDEAGRFLGRAGDRKALRASRVLTAWREVAGEEVARRTEGGRFRDGVLHVYVDSSAWANELQLMAETFKRSLNDRLGKETVGSIRFTVSRKVSARREREARERAAGRRYEPRGRAGAELAEDDRRRAERIARTVGDAEVSESLRRAMEADLRRRKPGGGRA